MGYDKFSRIRFCIPLLIIIAGAHALKEVNDTKFLFLPSLHASPPACPPNEVYKPCVGDCSDCERRGVCSLNGCAKKGCDCWPKFVRLTPGGPCESVQKCPVKECGENEVFRECGPACERCGLLRCRMVHCEHKCYCKEGYLREPGGKCVPEDQCPPKLHCHRNEEQGTSGKKDKYCIHDESDDARTRNTTERKDSCYCKEGYSRNTMGFCVDDELCILSHCFSGEEYQPCPRKCNVTCRSYGDPTCEEDGQCYPGCFCSEGKYADDHRRCVTLEECPPGSNPFAPTAGPTTTPAMTSSTASMLLSTETDPSGSNPTTAQDSKETTVMNDHTTGLPDEEIITESTTDTIRTVTSQATDQAGTETSAIPDHTSKRPKHRKPKDQEANSPKDQALEKVKDQATEKDQSTEKDQATEKKKDQAAGGSKDQVTDSPKDQATDSPKDQATDSPKDEATEQPGASTKQPTSVPEEDEESDGEVLETTTVKPKSSKKTGKERKLSTKARKATTPIDMEEENE